MPNTAVIAPQPGDEISAPWGQSVAGSLNGIQSGSVSLAGITNTVAPTVAVTFPRAFASPPNLVTGCPSVAVSPGFSGLTATGVTITARRNDGNASATTQVIQWLAIGTLA